VHRVPKSDVRMEWIDLGLVALVPVVAPGFLPFPPATDITPQRLQALTQCVIRDSARHPSEQGHFPAEGAPRCSVPDHLIKKELVLHGITWGHLPRFMIENELRDGSLLSIAGRHFPGIVEELSAARRRDRPHGPVADQLWVFPIPDNPGSIMVAGPSRSLSATSRASPSRSFRSMNMAGGASTVQVSKSDTVTAIPCRTAMMPAKVPDSSRTSMSHSPNRFTVDHPADHFSVPDRGWMRSTKTHCRYFRRIAAPRAWGDTDR